MLPFMKMISRDKRIKHLLLLPWGMGVLFHLSFKLFLYCTRSFIVVLVVVVVAALLKAHAACASKSFLSLISHCLQMRCDTIQYFSITTCHFQFHFQHFPITFVSAYLFGIPKYISRFHEAAICPKFDNGKV